MPSDHEKTNPIEQKRDAGDNTKPETSQKTAAESVSNEQQAKRFDENFESLSHSTKALGNYIKAEQPLILHDSTTGQTLYDASKRRAHAPLESVRDHKEIANKGTADDVIKQSMVLPVPDFKTLNQPGAIPHFVEVRLGPEDNLAIELRFKEHLHGKNPNTLSEFDRQKLHNLAIADVVIDKYQQALTRDELNQTKNLPAPLAGCMLARDAFIDGCALGATKAVLEKVINENAIGDLASGTAMGFAFGQTVAKLAANLNPWARGIGLLLQSGGVILAAEQIGSIGTAGVNGFGASLPSLEKLINSPSPENLAAAKKIVEDKMGPPLADTGLMASGFALAHGLEKTAGGAKGPGKNSDGKHEIPEELKPNPDHVNVGDRYKAGSLQRTRVKQYDARLSKDVVQQVHDESCMSAVGEMLSKGELNIKQAEFMKKIGTEKVDVVQLAKVLGDGWTGAYTILTDKALAFLLQSCTPFGVTLKKYGSGGHAVVVDGLNPKTGRLIIRDPAEGLKYEADKAEFMPLVESIVYKPRK